MRAGMVVGVLILALANLVGCRGPTAGQPSAADAPAASSASSATGTQSAAIPEIPAWSPPEVTENESEAYYGVFIMGEKAGWQRTTIGHTRWNGADALYLDTELHVLISMLGTSVKQSVLMQVVFDPDGHPLRGHYEIDSAGTQIVDALFKQSQVLWKRESGRAVRGGVLDVPEGADLTDPDIAARVIHMEVGDQREFVVFEPTMVQIVKGSYRVEAEEKIEVEGQEFDCYRTLGQLGTTGTMTSWVSATTGEVVRAVSTAVGMEQRLMDEKKAKEPPPAAAAYRPDLAEQTRIVVSRPIENPGRAMDLKLRVSGIPSKEVLIDDARQEWSDVNRGDDGKIAATVTIRVPPVPAEGDLAFPKGPTEFLAPTSMIEASDPVIKAKATEIVAGGTDPVVAARAIGRWVNTTVKAEPIGSIRSAREVLDDPRGVCRDYAALFAALGRAAGIPTKFAAGIVYWNREGAPGFYYHAWNEVCLDGRHWAAIDSTRPEPWPVDATHVKFAEGEVSSMTDVLGLIGALKIEVLE